MSGKCSDFDMVNAHPVILLWVCDSLKIRCPKLRHYVNYRDDTLEQMKRHTGKSRQFCKEQFLVSTNDEKPVFQKNTFDFLVEYDVEMKSVIHPSLTGQPEYQWLRKYLVDRDNFNGCFVNLILCYWENIILEYAVVYFQEQDIVPRVLKFDGLLVSKAGSDEQAGPVELNARESAWHCKMLRALCMHVLNINMKWTEKPLNDRRVVVPPGFQPQNQRLLFEEIAPEFNEHNKKVLGENYVTVNKDGSFTIRSKEKFKEYHNHIGFDKPVAVGEDEVEFRRRRFVYEWLDEYDDVPFYEQAREYPPGGPADRSECPDDHFNIWEPLAFERWSQHENPDGSCFEYNERAVEMFKDMMMGLVGDNEQHFRFFMEWNYTNLMHPATKSERCPFIISRQGAGKDTFVAIQQKILGSARCVTESDPSENIWGKFNENLQGSYLVVLTDVGMSDFVSGMGRIKHLITQYEYTLNLKGGAKIKKISSFHRFLGITNVGSQGEISPVPVTDDERRFVLFTSSNRLVGNQPF